MFDPPGNLIWLGYLQADLEHVCLMILLLFFFGVRLCCFNLCLLVHGFDDYHGFIFLNFFRNVVHGLPNSFVYLLLPGSLGFFVFQAISTVILVELPPVGTKKMNFISGLFSNHGPLYFVGTKRFF